MQLERLIAIITALQNNEILTAPCLAERLEVSTRTINRDIDVICRAGIPIVTRQGRGGGISIMEGFNLNTRVFTKSELSAIFAGLKSLNSVLQNKSYGAIAEKLSANMSASGCPADISIDLASFYIDSLKEKLNIIKPAIESSQCLSFKYYYSKGEAEKRVHPYLLVYKWSDWYLLAWCCEREDFRLFKINRLWELCPLPDNFKKIDIPPETLDFDKHISDSFYVTAVYSPSVKYRLIESYGPGCFTILQNDFLLATIGFKSKQSAIEWLLGFGEKACVTHPQELKNEIKNIAMKIYDLY